MMALDDIVLRDELDPRLGDRDDNLIAQYADIFDALPLIVINQDNELIDGWHRVRAAQYKKRKRIACVVVETDSDDDLGDKMWAANVKHGVQYNRLQREAYGVRLHSRGFSVEDIAQRVGVSLSSVYRWTQGLRVRRKQTRNDKIIRLRDEGKTTQEIADKVGVDRTTVAMVLRFSQMGKTQQGSEIETVPLEEIHEEILNAAFSVMGHVREAALNDYVAKLEAPGGQQMMITDDSLSDVMERDLLASAAAMCLWRNWMIWYEGERIDRFKDVFGKIGPVIVRGQSGQWCIVSELRLMLRRVRKQRSDPLDVL